jgi:hypothetical protein
VIASANPPAVDPASGHFVSQGSDPSGQTLLEQHQRMLNYVANYIQALQQASGQIQQVDDETQQSINKAGQGAM